MNSNTLELLSKETKRILCLQSDTLIETLKINNFLNPSTAEKEKTIGIEKIKEWVSHLENERQKLDKLEMVLAVVGTMKAGKSTTINAIVGMEVLPNRETAMTTLPTLVRNKHGQTQPILTINKTQPLLELSKNVANVLKKLNANEKEKIDLQGINDGRTLIEQLVQKGGYQFKSEYKGQNAIFEFLTHLNDIIRLAKDEAINIEPPYCEYENEDDLPVIEVEFYHLKDDKDMANGSLAILDTPGPNECIQSASLRHVFKTQMEKASAILLVTDFTQMKTDAEHEVRKQLDCIKEQLSKDRLYVAVNRFDQAKENSMSKEEVKNYVTNSLMQGKVEITQVFPVSSLYAYLVNRAKVHLAQNEMLPDYKKEPWVAEFAKKAFGECWNEEDINDHDRVEDGIKRLWKKSYFDEPVEKVIKEAHATAANKSLASAISKIAEYNREFSNTLNLRSNAMTKDISEIQKMMQSLKDDIDGCEQIKTNVGRILKECISQLKQSIDEIITAQTVNISDIINTFFQEGKRNEKEMERELLDRVLEKHAKNRNLREFLHSFFSAGKSKQENIEFLKEKVSQVFAPNSPEITCADASAARKMVADIGDSIASIFSNANEQLNSITNQLIRSTTQDISLQINAAVKDTLERAKDKLKEKGDVKVDFKLPDIDLSIDIIDTSQLFDAGYYEKTESKSYKRYKEGVWGSICEWVGTSDWGRETVWYDEKTHIVDINKIKEQALEKLNEQVSQLSNQTERYFNEKFQDKIDDHLMGLVEYLERYHGVLGDGMKSSQLDQAAKLELKKRLEQLSKTQAILKGDIDANIEAIKITE